MKLKIIPILFLVILVSCNIKLPGTNSGNPDNQQPNDNSQQPANPVIATSYISLLVSSACSRVSFCNSQISIDNCTSLIANISGFTSELGSTASSYLTVASLITAEKEKSVSVNTTNFTTCNEAIQVISCSDSLMLNAFSIANSNDFSNLKVLFQTKSACQQIY